MAYLLPSWLRLHPAVAPTADVTGDVQGGDPHPADVSPTADEPARENEPRSQWELSHPAVAPTVDVSGDVQGGDPHPADVAPTADEPASHEPRSQRELLDPAVALTVGVSGDAQGGDSHPAEVAPTANEPASDEPRSRRELCKSPRGCDAEVDPDMCIYCNSCYAEPGADYYLSPERQCLLAQGWLIVPEEQPPCDCYKNSMGHLTCCGSVSSGPHPADNNDVVHTLLTHTQASTSHIPQQMQPQTFYAVATSSGDGYLAATAPAPVLTSAQVGSFMPTVGGKRACEEQRRLRTWCLEQRPPIYNIDMARCTWPWQSLLQAMNKNFTQSIFAGTDGVCSFTFRLLKLVRDSNYHRKELNNGGLDPGYHHVFEVMRTDGQVWRLHYHRRGKMDSPQVKEPADPTYVSSEETIDHHDQTLQTMTP